MSDLKKRSLLRSCDLKDLQGLKIRNGKVVATVRIPGAAPIQHDLGPGNVFLERDRGQFRIRVVSEEFEVKIPFKGLEVLATPVPPTIPELVLTLLANTTQREAVLGDLNELFEADCAKLGPSRAGRLYWARALQSVWPLLQRAIGRTLKWTAILAVLKRLA